MNTVTVQVTLLDVIVYLCHFVIFVFHCLGTVWLVYNLCTAVLHYVYVWFRLEYCVHCCYSVVYNSPLSKHKFMLGPAEAGLEFNPSVREFICVSSNHNRNANTSSYLGFQVVSCLCQRLPGSNVDTVTQQVCFGQSVFRLGCSLVKT